MTQAGDPDAELMAELGAMLDRVDPVPPAVTEFARAALGWRRLEADLAELLEDSALELGAAALTRGGGDSRWLGFRAEDLGIEVELQARNGSCLVLGQLVPAPAAASIEVQGPDGVQVATAEADTLGRFRLELERGRRIRLRVVRLSATPVETSWLTL